MTNSDMSGDDDQHRALGRITREGTPLTAQVTVADAQALIDGMRNRQQSALAWHRSLQVSGTLRKATLVEYRCRERGCLLGRIFSTPVGPALFVAAQRYSPDRNQSTAAQARAERTADGDRRWLETAELLMEWNEPWLSCDHVLDFPLEPGRTMRDAREQRGNVVLLP